VWHFYRPSHRTLTTYIPTLLLYSLHSVERICFTVCRGVLGRDSHVRGHARGTREAETVRHTHFEGTSACVLQEVAQLGLGTLLVHGGPQKVAQENGWRHYWHGDRAHLQNDCGRIRGTALTGETGTTGHTKK